MEDQNIPFVPFHAINNFMIEDFRQNIITDVFTHLEQIENNKRGKYLNIVRKLVNIPGFRNSSNAPINLKIRGAINAFEKNPQFTIQTISCWADIHSDLRQKVYDLLIKREWKLLPVDADRCVLPGFQAKWHPNDTYEIINEAFKIQNPEDPSTENDVRLMVVWLSDRLPFEQDEK